MADQSFTVKSALLRADMLRRIREYFHNKHVLEVETPILSRGISTDCHLDIFSTFFHPDGFTESQQSTPLFMQTSPEFFMKRLLSSGFPDIYQMCKVFRNGENGNIHNPEFTMLEWYRLDFSMEDFIREAVEICTLILGERECVSLSYREIFKKHTGIDPLNTSFEDLLSFCEKQGKYPSHCTCLSDMFNYIMSEHVEPRMNSESLYVIHNFPSEQAVFAKLNPTDPRTALRFELYYKGVELCNGWEELAGESGEVRARMEKENELRKQNGKPLLPVDERFVDSAASFPPCSGAALGLDRLVMLAAGSNSIDSVMSFTLKDC
ncbi:Translation elongation factor P Lys34:lysine transferase [Chitinispirillum alkaliphilum]|nr:Translation elongation factor P Lys34:lysine transferase [Chitinispirillum alkaliphilum]